MAEPRNFRPCLQQRRWRRRQKGGEKDDGPEIAVFERIRAEKIGPGLVLEESESQLEDEREDEPENADSKTLRNGEPSPGANEEAGDDNHDQGQQHAAQQKAAGSAQTGNENRLAQGAVRCRQGQYEQPGQERT